MANGNISPIWDTVTGIRDFKDGEASRLSAPEILDIRENWIELRAQLEGDPNLAEFNERLKREWSIETGVIENLYDIDHGVTQSLIEHGFNAELIHHGSTDKPRDYVLQLLKDQKATLDGVFDSIKDERRLTTSYIKELHASLVQSQDATEVVDSLGRHVDAPLIKGDWKIQENYPVRDVMRYMYCPMVHVVSEMDRLIQIHSEHVRDNVSSEAQAAWLHHRFTQIHPFQDGNGRVARTLASLIFIKNGLFPLVITRGDRQKYIQALEDADKGDLGSLVAIFVNSQKVQFRKTSKISKHIGENRGTQFAVQVLIESAEAIRSKSEIKILARAEVIQEDLKQRLNSLIPDIELALTKIYPSPIVRYVGSDDKTEHYFRYQIIETAKRLNYYARLDKPSYKSWISLQMYWYRQARLVFSIHGIGKQHCDKALICSPFLEFEDIEDERESVTSLSPVTEDGFLFFESTNENEEQLRSRFKDWLEGVLRNFILKLSRNL